MFENKLIKGIRASRYVASWYNSKGTNRRYLNEVDSNKRRIESYFADWLRTIIINGEHLTEDEVRYIDNYATNGKMELEHSAEEFIRTHM